MPTQSNDPPPVAAGPPVSFQPGEKAVHPSHGVGEVVALEERDLGGTLSTVYVLKMFETGLKVMIPTEAVERVGLRPVMTAEQADEIFDILRAPEVAVDVQPWSRRFRAYTEMLKSGAATEIARVLRDMYRLKFGKELSFGERRLLDQAKGLLVLELALARDVPSEAIEAEMKKILSA